jgi:IS5 family transposase
VEKSTRRILCLAHDKGRRHDFRLFKTSKLHLHPETKAVVDSGYQGLQRAHANTAIPKKRSKKNPLSTTDKAKNRDISSERAACENVATIKRFKIIADRFRNRRRRFGLRFFLIAAIYNMELQPHRAAAYYGGRATPAQDPRFACLYSSTSLPMAGSAAAASRSAV